MKKILSVIFFLFILSSLSWAGHSTTVINCNDSGTGSLRQILSEAIAGDQITFALTTLDATSICSTGETYPGLVTNEATGKSWFRIIINSGMAIVGKDGIVIDGSTQPNLPTSEAYNPSGPNVELRANGSIDMLNLNSNNLTVEGLALNRTGANLGTLINISGANNCQIRACYLGTTATGEARSPNSSLVGISIYGLSDSNKVGDGTAAGRNVISGCSSNGISMNGTAVTYTEILGNYIGTNASGTAAINNSIGILVGTTTSNTKIGNGTAGGRNIISGNSDGISFNAPTATNEVLDNYIGTNFEGTSALPNNTGISFTNGKFAKIGNGRENGRNIISGNTSCGLLFSEIGSTNNEVLGNFIGTDVDGNNPVANQYGVYFQEGASNNKIGNGESGGGNTISGNSLQGIIFYSNSNNNEVLGNYIGTTANGQTALPNNSGVVLLGGSSYNLIGDGTDGGRNIISGNDAIGIKIYETNTNSNEAKGNYIGLNSSGTTLGNGQDGVYIYNGASFNKIGPGNYIANNGTAPTHYGILVDGATNVASNELITQNQIFGNLSGAIKLTNNGNQGILAPTISSANRSIPTGLTSISGTGAPSGGVVEVFRANGTQCDNYLGTTTANGSGVWSLSVAGVNSGEAVTATSTRNNSETSELSVPKAVINTIFAGYQPDNEISKNDGYIGLGILNTDGTSQTKTSTIIAASSETYYVRINNSGNISDEAKVVASGSGAGWNATFYDAETGGNDITSQVLSTGGWISSSLSSAESKVIRFIVAYTGTSLSTLEVLVTSTSTIDATKSDAVKATTTGLPLADNFSLTLPSSSTAGVSFSSTITARKADGTTQTTVTGTTALSVDSGTISPISILASAFTSGVWTGNLNLLTPGRRTITATNGLATGTALITIYNATREYSSSDLGVPGMSISIPAGTASSDVTATVAEDMSPHTAPAGHSFDGRAYTITFSTTDLLLPITVTMPITSTSLIEPMIFVWNGTSWVRTTVTVTARTSTSITFTTTASGVYAVMGASSGNLFRVGPNPYNPNNGSLRIWYWLESSKETSIYIMDLSGTLVYKQTYTTGTNGAQAGENNVEYNGKTSWGDVLGNGVYLYKIVQDGKSVGGGKLAIIK